MCSGAIDTTRSRRCIPQSEPNAYPPPTKVIPCLSTVCIILRFVCSGAIASPRSLCCVSRFWETIAESSKQPNLYSESNLLWPATRGRLPARRRPLWQPGPLAGSQHNTLRQRRHLRELRVCTAVELWTAPRAAQPTQSLVALNQVQVANAAMDFELDEETLMYGESERPEVGFAAEATCDNEDGNSSNDDTATCEDTLDRGTSPEFAPIPGEASRKRPGRPSNPVRSCPDGNAPLSRAPLTSTLLLPSPRRSV
mmetsp:Transcript_23164/g.58417  ORF Transcript_23164/g.58417 Transcript_23164/m.58417 type:complete len:254 (+) Transcript_23164:2-763(+)